MCIYTILSLLIIFVLISSVSAADVNTDATNLTSLSGNDEIVGIQNEFDVLGIDTSTFSVLKDEIGNGGNKTLQHDYYTSNGAVSTIDIQIDNSVIDGNGAVIDMAGSNIRVFNVFASGVTIKNLTIINASHDGDGAAFYFTKAGGTIENCNFIDNSASGMGGVVYFNQRGTLSNCNFTGNTADFGGAVYLNSDGSDYFVTNCNFNN